MATAYLQSPSEQTASTKLVRPTCPTGRVEVSGTVLSTKITPDRGYGIGRKMLIELETGVRIFGNAPLGIDKGNTVVMKATIEPSVGDPTFGTFARPTIISSTPPTAQQTPTPASNREQWYQKI